MTDDLGEKVSKYSLSVVPESFVRESIKTNTPLPLFTSHFGDLQQKENHPNHFSPSSSPILSSSSSLPLPGQPYSPTVPFNTTTTPFPSTSSPPTSQPLRSYGIRERLKGLSLKSKNKQTTSPPLPSPSSSPTISNYPPPPPAQRTRMRKATHALCESLHLQKKGGKDEDSVLPLRGLVFVVYGTFSISTEMMEHLILTHGGRHVASVTSEVSPSLFFLFFLFFFFALSSILNYRRLHMYSLEERT